MNGVLIAEPAPISSSDTVILGDLPFGDTQLSIALRRISAETEDDPQATVACFNSAF